MKRVLIITYYWPPSGGSGVQRWLKLSKYLPEFGIQPIIYTPENPEANTFDSTLEKDISKEVVVIKRKIWEPYRFYKFLTGKNKNISLKANIIEGTNSGGLINFIRSNFFVPDPRKFWINPSCKYLKRWYNSLSPQERPCAVISSGPPHSMHLIAQKFKKEIPINWLADFRDPWTRMFYFKHLNLTSCSLKKHRKLEKDVLKDSDYIFTVSDHIKEDFVNDISSISGISKAKEKVITLENGFDPEDFDEQNNRELREEITKTKKEIEGYFVIGHTGLLTNSANPSIFWEAIGEFSSENQEFKKSLKIITSGQTDSGVVKDIENNNLKNSWVDWGYTSHYKAIALQKHSNLLLLPLRKEPEAKGILTGKLFEYLASGNRIVAFGYSGCNLENILMKTAGGTLFYYDSPNSKELIKKELSSQWAKYKSGIKNSINYAEVQKFSRREQARELANFINQHTQFINQQ